MKRILSLGMAAALLLCLAACGNQSSAGSSTASQSGTSAASLDLPASASPAETPSACDGFGALGWGDKDSALTGGEYEIVQKQYPFGDYYCSAFYQFGADGTLTSGYYQFNESGNQNGIEVYCGVRSVLLETYGASDTGLTETASNGSTQPAPTIEDVIAAGKGTCMEKWSEVKTSGGESVLLTLQLLDNGEVIVGFLAGQ